MLELLISALAIILINIFIMIACDIIFDFEFRNATTKILVVANGAIATILLAIVIYADVGLQIVVNK